MGISNVSNGLRSGVCTSTTRPSAPYEGQMIYETDTNRVLVYDNTAWVMIADTDTPPGLQLISTASGTTASSIPVNSCFSSEFQNYLIVISVTSSANTNISIKLRSGTTNKSANYYNGAFYMDLVGTATLIGENSAGATTAGLRVAATNTSGITSSFVDLGNPFNTGRTTFSSRPQASETYFRLMSGYHAEDYSADGIDVIPSSGTITGSVRVYGYRN